MSVLAEEKAKTKERMAILRAATKLEKLQKEATDCERDLVTLQRPSIFTWLGNLFKKGG